MDVTSYLPQQQIFGSIEYSSGKSYISDGEETITQVSDSTASFILENFAIIPENVNIGEPVVVTATVTNTRGLAGTYQATLLVNGSVFDNQEISLAGNESREITFNISKDMPGSYEVRLGGYSGTLTVNNSLEAKTTKASINWWLVALIPGVVVIGGCLTGLLLWKKKHRQN
jgi:subtilase family serine protease